VQCSLYIHLPFCRSKCRYCDFYSVTDHATLIDGYLGAVAREWELRTKNAAVELSSVFIGGGTPSLLSVDQWGRFRSLLLARLPLVQGAEWTIECNPESFTEDKAGLFADMGVTRLTFGIQSMVDRELAIAGRPHTARDAGRVLDAPGLSSFSSIGVDLIYGLPGQTAGSFADTLHQVFERPMVKHLSAYELTVSESTPFGRHRSLLPFPSEEECDGMARVLSEVTEQYGFKQYEVSNYAQEGCTCRHNIGYWSHEAYIGLGCAAHSYLHPIRSWNVDDIGTYCRMVDLGYLPIEREETLSAEMLVNEILFLGLRRVEGINVDFFHEKTGTAFEDKVAGEKLKKFCREGYLLFDPPCWRPTKKGLLFADFMARELF
jgi:oxygen-independent coproporphyrinogen III oxidase